MLSLMRKKAGSWMIKVILALIVVVFMFWGVGSFRNQQATVVASVDGMPITYDEYNRVYNDLIEQLSRQMGSNLNEETLKMFQVKKQALDRIIDRRLMLAEANRLGFMISDQELIDSIQSISAFQRDGKFDNNLYQGLLNRLRMTPEGFELDQRDSILIDKLRAFVAGNVKVSDAEARQKYDWQDATVAIEYLLVEPRTYKDVKPSLEELETYYNEKKENYKTEPEIKARYVRFMPQDYMAQVEVSADEIRDYFETNAEDFETPKTVEARHILIKVDPEADDATVETARQKILEVLKKAQEGDDFAELAKTYSEGPSGSQGGLLGAFKKEEMVAPFSEKAFSMKVGELSDPVRTRFGWHLIKVEKINPASSQTLAEATDQIKNQLSLEKARVLAYDAAEALYDAVIEGENIEQVANDKKLSVKTTDFFGRQGPPNVGAGRSQFATTAFDLKEMDVSEIIDSGDSLYLLQPVEKQPPNIPPLADVKDKVSTDWVKQRQDEMARADAEALLAELKKGETMSAAGKKHALTPQATEFFKRNEAISGVGAETGITQAAFELSEAKNLAEKVVKGQKGYYLIQLKNRQVPDPAGFEAQKDKIVQQLQREKGFKLYNTLLARLRADSEINIKPEFIE